MTELHHALAHPGVQAYLARPFTTDFKHHVPLTGGSNVPGTTYYGDEHLPRTFRTPVMVHERIEKALRSVLGMSQDHAHVLATAAEKLTVLHKGMNWGAYKKAVAVPVRQNEKAPQTNLPPDLDREPEQIEAREKAQEHEKRRPGRYMARG